MNKLTCVIEEIDKYAALIKEEELKGLADCILQADTVFVAGAGRSGFIARGFANRLLHLNRKVAFVGEVTTPPIKKGDLLILISGSGRTASLVTCAAKAKEMGAEVAAITIFPDAPVGEQAKARVVIPGASHKKEGTDADSVVTIQPMGTLFEQLSWLVCDSVVLYLMEALGEDNASMSRRHANLE